MKTELENYRKEIDSLDEKIVSLFEERMKISEKIGQFKRENSLPILDESRENKKLSSVISMASDTMKPYTYRLYKEIFSLSRTHQDRSVVCRLAERDDLDEIRRMFSGIVDHMNKTGITIWNDIYPNEVFPEDIDARRLYLLIKNGVTVAAFALLEPFFDTAKSTVVWEEAGEDALYLYRLGVNSDYLGQGLASVAMEYAKAITRAKGRRFLRLYVVDKNTPAVRLYTKTGFRKAPGVRTDDVATDKILIESGFEAIV